HRTAIKVGKVPANVCPVIVQVKARHCVTWTVYPFFEV
ncbi:hypothetical protein EATG_03058, partial [Escherichia coli H605]